MGINLAEGRAVFIMNADLHVERGAIDQLEALSLQPAQCRHGRAPGIAPRFQEPSRCCATFEKGTFDEPVRTHDVSGFFFAIHRERFLQHRLQFDVQYSPCFMEEWDMGLQVIQAELACYAVPVAGFEHHWGVSVRAENTPISYFGRDVYRNDVLEANRQKFLKNGLPAAGSCRMIRRSGRRRSDCHEDSFLDPSLPELCS